MYAQFLVHVAYVRTVRICVELYLHALVYNMHPFFFFLFFSYQHAAVWQTALRECVRDVELSGGALSRQVSSSGIAFHHEVCCCALSSCASTCSGRCMHTTIPC